VDSTIDFSRIRQKRIVKFLKEKRLTSLNQLAGLCSQCYEHTERDQYHKHRKTFLIDAELAIVWDIYKTIRPEDTWCGAMVSFGMMYSRGRNEVTYANGEYHGLEAGQLLFLNLNLLANFLNIAVGHEVVNVDDESKCITICYLEHGASKGTQKFWLEQGVGHQTKIIHETWYTSGSWFRDKVLYPVFHSKAISEFHNNVKRKAEMLIS
jgi:hypothetical protein